MKIAVAGGTGTVGRHVVDVLAEQGHDHVVLSRSAGVDVLTGVGVAEALSGTQAVIDVLSVSTRSGEESERFFRTTTESLLAAEQAAGVGHHVLLSIVGIDASPFGYYAGKIAQERVVEAGAVPWTNLRATQFHEFVHQALGFARLGPVIVVPRMRTQPVAAREVAERLVALAVGSPVGRAADLGGPREESLATMVRGFLQARGKRDPVLTVPLPGPQGRAMAGGALLTGPGAELGTQTYAEWLETLSTES